MTEPDHGRPGSSATGYRHASPIPSSPRPSVASRASRGSLRRDRDRHDTQAHPRSTSAAFDDAAGPSSPITQPGPPSIGPLFALVSSNTHPSHRQTTPHPTLHYIFADDEPEHWTEALAQHHRRGEEQTGNRSVRERAVVLNMVPADNDVGFEVAWASSLSPDWAVVSAKVSRMDGMASRTQGDGALVLNIEGMNVETSAPVPLGGKTPTPEGELQSSGASGAKGAKPQQAVEEYAGLLADFEKRMGVLKRVVEAGAERERIVKAEAEAERERIAKAEAERERIVKAEAEGYSGETGGPAGGDNEG